MDTTPTVPSETPQVVQEWQPIDSPSLRFGSASSALIGPVPGTLFHLSSVSGSSASEGVQPAPPDYLAPNFDSPPVSNSNSQQTPSLPTSEVGFTQLVAALCDDNSQNSQEGAFKTPLAQAPLSSGMQQSPTLQRDDTTLIQVPPLHRADDEPQADTMDETNTLTNFTTSTATATADEDKTPSISDINGLKSGPIEQQTTSKHPAPLEEDVSNRPATAFPDPSASMELHNLDSDTVSAVGDIPADLPTSSAGEQFESQTPSLDQAPHDERQETEENRNPEVNDISADSHAKPTIDTATLEATFDSPHHDISASKPSSERMEVDEILEQPVYEPLRSLPHEEMVGNPKSSSPVEVDSSPLAALNSVDPIPSSSSSLPSAIATEPTEIATSVNQVQAPVPTSNTDPFSASPTSSPPHASSDHSEGGINLPDHTEELQSDFFAAVVTDPSPMDTSTNDALSSPSSLSLENEDQDDTALAPFAPSPPSTTGNQTSLSSTVLSNAHLENNTEIGINPSSAEGEPAATKPEIKLPLLSGRSNSETMGPRTKKHDNKLHGYTPIKSDGTGIPEVHDKSPLRPFELPTKPKRSPPPPPPKTSSAKRTGKSSSKRSSARMEVDEEPDMPLRANRSRRSAAVSGECTLNALLNSHHLNVGDILQFEGSKAIIMSKGWLETGERTSAPLLSDWIREVLLHNGTYSADDDDGDDQRYWKKIDVIRVDPVTGQSIKTSRPKSLFAYAQSWKSNASPDSLEFLVEEPPTKKRKVSAKATQPKSPRTISPPKPQAAAPPSAKASKKPTVVVATPYSLDEQFDEDLEAEADDLWLELGMPKKAPSAAKSAPKASAKVTPSSSSYLPISHRFTALEHVGTEASSHSRAKPTATVSNSPRTSGAKKSASPKEHVKSTASTSTGSRPSTIAQSSSMDTSDSLQEPKRTTATTTTATTTTHAKKSSPEPKKSSGKKASSAKAKQTASSSETQAPVIISSGLTGVASRSLNTIVDKLGGRIEPQFTPQTTHLVVNVDASGLVSRTFKYLEALLRGVYIVTTEWLVQSLPTGKYLPSANFLAKGDSHCLGGPSSAILHRQQGGSALKNEIFKDLVVCLYGVFDSPTQLKLTQIEHLLRLGGAKVKHAGGKSNVSPLDVISGESNVIVVCDDSVDGDAALSLALQTGSSPISLSWVIDSISHCESLDTTSYLIIESPQEDLNASISW